MKLEEFQISRRHRISEAQTAVTNTTRRQTMTIRVSKDQMKAATMLGFFLNRKMMDRKVSFWINLREMSQSMDSLLKKELHHSEDFGKKVLNQEQLEAQLFAKFNKVELKRIDEKPKKRRIDYSDSEDEKVGELPKRDASKIFDPLRFMENNLGDISVIGGPGFANTLNFTAHQFGEETLQDELLEEFKFLGDLHTSRFNA